MRVEVQLSPEEGLGQVDRQPSSLTVRAEVKILHGRGGMLRRAIKELQAHPTAFLPRAVWFSDQEEFEQIFGDLVHQ